MKKQFLSVIIALFALSSYAQINPAPINKKPIPNKNLQLRPYVENVALLKSYYWWKRINPGNTIYFQSINLVSVKNNDTSLSSYTAKTIMTLIGFDSYANLTSLSNDSLVHLQPLIYLEKLLVRSDINDAGIMHLANLKNLRHLEAAYTSGLHYPGRYENRDIHNNSMDIVAGFRFLEILRLHYCRSVTDDGLAKLQGLTNLKELDLSEWNITDKGLNNLAGMKKLEILNLTGTNITDAGIDILVSILPGMSSFVKINLTGTNVSAKGRQKFSNSFPRITIL